MQAQPRLVAITQYKNRALVATLRELTKLAEAGVIHGHAFIVKFGPGDHRAGLSGDYKRMPAEALTAAVLMERHLAGASPPIYEAVGDHP